MLGVVLVSPVLVSDATKSAKSPATQVSSIYKIIGITLY